MSALSACFAYLWGAILYSIFFFFCTRRLVHLRNPDPIPPHLSFAWGDDHFIVVPCLAIVANTPASYTSFDTTSPRDPADDHDMEPKFSALDRSIPPSWSASYRRSLLYFYLQHCLLPPIFVSTSHLIQLAIPPHDHCTSVSDQHWCAWSSSIRTPISYFPVAIVLLHFPFLAPIHIIRRSSVPMTIIVPCRLRRGCTRWRSSAQMDALRAGSG